MSQISEKRRLIEVLADLGISKVTLSEAANEYYEVQFGKWLVSHGVITEEQLQLALAQQYSEIGDFPDAQNHLTHLSKTVHQDLTSRLDSTLRAFQGLSSLIASTVEGHAK
jgi:hypothetical protein